VRLFLSLSNLFFLLLSLRFFENPALFVNWKNRTIAIAIANGAQNGKILWFSMRVSSIQASLKHTKKAEAHRAVN